MSVVVAIRALAGPDAISDDLFVASHGQGYEVLRMRVELSPNRLREPTWPDGVHPRSFEPRDAESLHALLEHGYRRGGGTVAAFGTWLTQMTTDEEFDPQLWLLAESQEILVGAVLCWTSAFVKDVVVHERWRRRGLGEALLLSAFNALAGRGATVVELKVEAANDNAVRLYERLGMEVVDRFERSSMR
jgi:ribosomal protein S18 acetylase RimI-like enzyme